MFYSCDPPCPNSCSKKEKIRVLSQTVPASKQWQQLLHLHVIPLTALTSVLCIMEKVVCKLITAMLSDSMDPLQLLCQANTGAENAFTIRMSQVGQTLSEPLLKVN